MNRIECLQVYPVRYRKAFYLGAPTVFILFAVMFLMRFSGMSFQAAANYWYLPALGGGLFAWYSAQNALICDTLQKDIDADASALQKSLERTKSYIAPLILGVSMVYALVMMSRSPYYKEMGQVANCMVMAGFFGLSAYFRQVLHIYARTSNVSDKVLAERYTERGMLQMLGWLSLLFFFAKTIWLKGAGNLWSSLPEIQMPNSLLISAIAVYAIGVLGITLQTFLDRKELRSCFESYIAFGSAFPIVWFYPLIHPYLFMDIPAWIIQLPLLFLLFVNSVGMLLAFQDGLQQKILGNTCLWFVKQSQQILAFIGLWAVTVNYVGWSKEVSLLLCGGLVLIASVVSRVTKNQLIPGIIVIIVFMPFLIKILNGEMISKIEDRTALIKEFKLQKESLGL